VTHASRAAPRRSKADDLFEELLAGVDVRIGGDRPWDLTVHHPDTANRILAEGSLGMGESYMDGWWDCPRIDELLLRILQGHLDERVGKARMLALGIANLLFNRQSQKRAWQVGRMHYDLDYRVFEAMLDERLNYSCGYWARASTLEQAQSDKLELTCRKLGLQAGMRLLDIGCGWGSLMGYAAENFGVECVGITISAEQAEYARRRYAHLPIEVRLQDYRAFNGDGRQRFDRIASIGMFEHVGHKNYRDFFATVARCLDAAGLCLLHTIGRRRSDTVPDPWIDRYIFPNHELPSLAQIAEACEGSFVIEDVENFGADYDRTLLAWHERLEAAWPALSLHHDERFRRMMRYYLLACAASFRARIDQLWQLVLSPAGVAGGYRRPAIADGSRRQVGNSLAQD
jgi:cyclopropane-fatty-acyl-phospholipid synthase